MIIYFDIETIPSQREGYIDEIASTIKAPATMKKTETILAWEQNEKAQAVQEAYLKTSFSGLHGEICCIGYALDDNAPVSHVGTEKEIIERFFKDLSAAYEPSNQMKPLFIGHNVSDFDLRFLFQRAVINGVKPPSFIPFHAKSWSDSIFDTMTYFAGYGNRVSLDNLCKALGIEGKQGINGADVWPMYQEGKIQEIAKYCRHDVDITRQVYKRLTFQQLAA